jgi:hypothetical protein
MISWDTMTPSSLSSSHHGHTLTTFPPCQNWTPHALHLLLRQHPCLRVRHLLLSRAWRNSTTRLGKLFTIKHNSRWLDPRKRTCLSHIMKRGRTALHSDFFGLSNYPEHSGTLHHQDQHQYHIASYKHRRVLRNRGDVRCCHRSRPSPLHKSTLRFLLYGSFSHLFFSLLCLSALFGYTMTHAYLFRASFMLPIISSYSSILSHLIISIVVCCEIKIACNNLTDDRMNGLM